MTTPSLHERAREEERSAMNSLFAIHKTNDPPEVVFEAMEVVLQVYTKRLLSLAQEAVPGEEAWIRLGIGQKHGVQRTYGWTQHREETLLALSKLR